MFEVGKKVNTPKGVGIVDFVEDDDYMEVKVNGVLFEFTTPFHGISVYKEPIPVEENPIISIILDVIEREYPRAIANAKLNHTHGSLLASMVGDNSASWEELNNFQKLNFIFLGSKISVEKILENLGEKPTPESLALTLHEMFNKI